MLAVLSFSSHAPVFFSDFTYDGRLVAGDNQAIGAPGAFGLLFSPEYFHAFGENTYRPLVTASYILDQRLYGKSKAGFAFTTLCLHTLASLGLFFVVRRRAGLGAGIFAAALFAVHPASSEAIYCVGHREAVLGGLFLFWALEFHDRATGKSRALSLVLFALGLFAIESVILLPVFILAEDLVRRRKDLRRALRAIAPQAAIAVAFLAARALMLEGVQRTASYYGGSMTSAAIHAAGALFTYFRLLLFPVALRPDYGGMAVTVTSGAFWGGVILAVLILVAILSRRFHEWTRLGLIWILISLAPVLHILMPFWIPLAERYLYLGAGAFALALSSFLFRLPARHAVLRSTLSFLLIAAMGVLCLARGLDWKDDLHLWRDATEKQPGSHVAWTNLAQSYLRAGNREGRLRALENVLLVDPANVNASVNLAELFREAEDEKGAYEILESGLKRRPDSGPILEALGLLALGQGSYDDAENRFRKLADTPEGDFPAARGMAQVYFAQNRLKETLGFLASCFRHDENDAMCNQILGHLNLRAGKWELSRLAFETCVRNAKDISLRSACVSGKRRSLLKLDEGIDRSEVFQK